MMIRSSVHTTTTSTHGRTQKLQRKAPIDRIVRALEFYYREHDHEAAVTELAKLDEAGQALVGKMLIHMAQVGDHDGDLVGAMGTLVDAAFCYAETGDDSEVVARLTEFCDDDRYPLHMAEFWESEIEFSQGHPDEIEECRQKAHELRQLAADTKGGAA